MARTKTIKTEASGDAVLGSAFGHRIDRATLLPKLKVAALSFATAWAVYSCSSTVFASDAPVTLPGNSAVNISDLVGGFAVDFVQDYLQSSQGSPRDLARYITVKDKLVLPASPQQFTEARVAYRKQTNVDGDLSLWTVVVSGRLNPQSATDSPRSYFQVPITLNRNAPRAILIPRQVKAPPLGVDLSLAYDTEVPDDTSLGQAVTGFIRAYLTGGADLQRYTSAESGIEAINPKPFETVLFADRSLKTNMDTIPNADGATVSVYADAYARTKAGIQIQMPYTVTVSMHSGRWQVDRLDDIPTVSTDSSGTPSDSPKPSASITAPPGRRAN